jgi:hypothetical protein
MRFNLPGDAPDVGKTKDDWTIAFDFNIELGDRTGHLGPEQKMATLRQFAKDTKGKPITIVAQTVMEESDPQKQDVQATKGGAVLSRYLIRNGEIKTLSVSTPGSFQQDLSDLLDTALEQSNGKKLGLVINDHGDDGAGFQGKEGFISFSQFDSTVKSSLNKFGRDKLDLLDLDSCLGGNVTVIDHVQSYADHLVASEAYEKGQTQKHSVWLSDLALNPGMNGSQLADTIVEEARKGSYAAGGINQVDTLAHYNLKDKYTPFHQAIDSFATALASSASNPLTQEALDGVIRESRPATNAFSFPLLDQYDTDLGKLTDGVLKNIATVDDAQHNVKKSAEQLLVAQRELVQSFYGSSQTDLSGLAGNSLTGVSVFLPNRADFNTQRAAQDMTTIGRFSAMVNPNLSLSLRKENIPLLPFLLERQIDPLAKNNGDAVNKLEAIHRMVNQLSDSSLPDEQVGALENSLYQHALEIAEVPPFNTSRDYFKLKLDTEIMEHLNGEQSGSSWSSLLTALQTESTVDTRANWQKLAHVTTQLEESGN